MARRQDRRSPAPAPASAPPSAPAESGAPSGEPVAGTTLSVVAKNAIAFETPTLTAPANSPITIEFDNQDVVPHNVKMFKDATGGETVYDGEIFNGPDTRSYAVGPLAAGTYTFICTVHPNMTGTLTVQ